MASAAFVLALVVASDATIFAARHWLDPEFFASISAGTVATLVGITIGVPVGLYVDRVRQRAEGASRSDRVRDLLLEELRADREALAGRAGRADIQMVPLRDQTWTALAAAGELRWIEDLDLLNDLSTAYHRIRTTIYLEELLTHAALLSAVRIREPGGQGRPAKLVLLDVLRDLDPAAIEALDVAIAALNARRRPGSTGSR